MADRTEAEVYISEHFDQFLEDLLTLVSQPSISATGEGVAECTTLLESLCQSAGIDETRIVQTPGQPSIIARTFVDGKLDNERPTVLIYGHYDVQPVDPDQWTTPPFEADVRDGPNGEPYIYGRGVSDMKAQLFAHICAIEALHETTGLPANVTLFLEGEEESGSPNVEKTIEEHADLLAADVLYHPDGEMDESGHPLVKLGDRGLLPVQIDVTGADRELHSGNFGGPIPNTIRELVRVVDSMTVDDGSVAIDGFYEDVRGMTDLDRRALDDVPFDEESLKERLDVPEFAPGPGDTFPEKIMYHPYLNFSGFKAGYGGEGIKNIIPPEATLKFDARLVPDQDPDDIFEKIVRHVGEHARNCVTVDVTRMDGDKRTNRPSGTPLDSPLLPAVEDAIERVWGVEPIVYQRSGASGPADVFERVLDVPHFSVPYGSTGSRRHGPNENMAVGHFRNGIRTSAHVLFNISEEMNS